VKRGALRLLALTIVLAVLSLPLGPWLVRESPLDTADAILVLGSHEHERLPSAARLAARWPHARVLLTEPVAATPYNCQDCAQRVSQLERLGVVRTRVAVMTPRVRNTRDELQVALGWSRRHGLVRVVVVTSPYHTRRVQGWLSALAWPHPVGVRACEVEGGLARVWWSRDYDRRYTVYEVAAMAANSWRDGVHPRHWFAPSAPLVGTL
jgi:uncharacterized SAM-binding protein YcdF (DUF218 family)